MAVGRDEAIAVVAAAGLSGARPWPGRRPLGDDEFGRLLDDVVRHRLTGHLVTAIETGAVPAGHAQFRASADRHHAALASDLALERLLIDTSRRFRRAGIAHRALKGPVLARTAYPTPALRSFGDIDVLVEAPRFDDAVALLAAEGAVVGFREPRRHFTSRFGKGVDVRTPAGLEVDLHRVFCAGPFGLAIDDRDLFGDCTPIDVGGVEIPALGPTLRMLHACYHAALGGPGTLLTAVRDVAELADRSLFDLDEVLDVATRWRGRIVVAAAAALVPARLAVDADGPLYRWAATYRPDRFERTAIRPYTSPGRTYAGQAAAGFWAIRGVRRRAAYGAAMLFPTSAYLQEREGSYRRRLRRAVSLARHR